MTYIKWKFKTEPMRTKSLPVIFQPELNLCMDLLITENLVPVNPTKSKAIKILIYNPNSNEMRLKNKILLEHLERIFGSNTFRKKVHSSSRSERN